MSLSAAPPGSVLAAANPVVVENQQAGSSAWQLGKLVTDDKTGQIQGYASATSVAPGDKLAFFVTTNPAQTYSMDFFRVGWYGGLGARLRQHVGPLDGIHQAPCVPDATTGLIACGWTPTFSFVVPADWTSGVYLVLLTNAAGYQAYMTFVVRDGRPATFLYEQSVNTYQAYNNYPDDGATGKSIYTFNSRGANTVSGDARAVKVSFDRPYTGYGAGTFVSLEINLVRWLERNGYDVTYSTDIDVHANGADLQRHNAFFSAGHDEYWSKEMYDAAIAARDAGVNLAFFGANAVYWQVRFEPSSTGVANRVMVCYKDAAIDPVQGATTTIRWRDIGRAEQALDGVQYVADVPWGSNVPWVVTNSNHWLYAGTGLKDGDSVPGIVGYEMDRFQSNYPAPPANGTQTLLSHSPFTARDNGPEYSNASIYQAPSGALVFASGTTSFNWALDNYWYTFADARMQRLTANLLSAFVNGTRPQALKVSGPATATAGQSFSVSVLADDGTGNPVPSYSGTVHFATSDTSAGVVLPADAKLTNGQGTFAVTLIAAGPQTLTVSDAANGLSTTVPIAVAAQPASQIVMSAAGSPTAGTAFPFAVSAQDQFGNIDTTYSGTLHFTTSDTSSGVALPPDTQLANGQATLSATLISAGAQTITARDTVTASIAGTLAVTVLPGAAAVMTMNAPASVPANQPFTLTVGLADRFGNVASGYAGQVHFSSSDLLATLPPDYTFTAADAGSHSFAAKLMTPLTQSITVADTANGSLRATRQINVTVAGLGGLP